MYIYIKFWIGAYFSKLVNSAPIKKSDVFSYIKTKKWIFEWQKAPKQSENTHNRLEKILLHKKLIAFIKMHTNLQIVRIRQKTQNWGWERRKGSCLMEIFFFSWRFLLQVRNFSVVSLLMLLKSTFPDHRTQL